jgi:hypothetical protein
LTHAHNPPIVQAAQAHNNNAGILEIHMDECLLVRHVENLEHLKKFDQNGQVAIPISEWIWFFEALALLAHGGGRREINCEVGPR